MADAIFFRYYLVTFRDPLASLDVEASLQSLLEEENVCKINEELFFVRASGKGRNGEFIYNHLIEKIPTEAFLCITTIGIRTIISQNAPEKLRTWAEEEVAASASPSDPAPICKCK